MNRAMQVTIAKAVLAGYRLTQDGPNGRGREGYWYLYTPDGGWVGMLFDSQYDAAKRAVEYLEINM